MANEQTSSVVMRMPGNQSSALFPKEFRKGLFTHVDKRFTLILSICGFVIFTVFAILSLRKPSVEVSEKEITQIQERYARLVLNQEKPEVKVKEVPKATVAAPEQKEETQESDKEKPKVEREKETFVEKQKRKESGVEERRQIREQVAKQIQSSGIFAAITAAGNSGGTGGDVSDLLGNVTQGTADLGSISVSKGSFATKKDDTAGLATKKGVATTGVDLERQNIARTEVTRVASSGSVNITSQAPEVSGESSSHADRSQSAIQRVVNRETQRLKRVYEDWLKRDPALNGSLTVKFVILPSGAVSNVSIVKSSTGNGEFDETILRYIKRWQFPPVPDSGPVEVVYPFVFEGQS
jgi:TonB family protein